MNGYCHCFNNSQALGIVGAAKPLRNEVEQ